MSIISLGELCFLQDPGVCLLPTHHDSCSDDTLYTPHPCWDGHWAIHLNLLSTPLQQYMHCAAHHLDHHHYPCSKYCTLPHRPLYYSCQGACILFWKRYFLWPFIALPWPLHLLQELCFWQCLFFLCLFDLAIHILQDHVDSTSSLHRPCICEKGTEYSAAPWCAAAALHAGFCSAIHAGSSNPVVSIVQSGDTLHQLSAGLHHPTLLKPYDLWGQRWEIQKILD